ncbi:hypothetical protein DFH11DRAFT_1694663 [Phellopilus nigrolimitatus]|nr:hypothetical protein DFH11DRAFT_1694663 [Phellopilus nigrolimitatus]
MADTPELSGLITAIDHVRYSLVYDYLLTVNAEKALVWSSSWSPPKILFLLTRYLPFFDTTIVIWYQFRPQATLEECLIAYKTTGWLILLGIFIAEIILILRTWAVWERHRTIGIGLFVWTVVTWAPIMTSMGIFLNSLECTRTIPLILHNCRVVSQSGVILAICWILLMVFEAGDC